MAAIFAENVSGTRKAAPSFAPADRSNGPVDFVAGFVFWHFNLAEDEPELPAQNFFNEFMLLCTCARCGGVSEPVDLGKL